jgi:hypothetical protein
MPIPPGETFLGRPLTEEEITVAAETPALSVGLLLARPEELGRSGIQSLRDLALAPPSYLTVVLRYDPADLPELRRTLEAKLDRLRRLVEIKRGGADYLASSVEQIVNNMPPRRRTVVEMTLGLWEGPRAKLAAAAEKLGVSISRAQQLRESALVRLSWQLGVASPAFECTLRSVFIELLQAKAGMARVDDWDEPASSFYTGQKRACLAFALVCRACQVEPRRLATIGQDGVCYDSLRTKFQREQAMNAVKSVLVDVGRPLPFEELRGRVLRCHGVDAAADFLRRSIELSQDVGLERGGAVGLRQWDYFDAHTLWRMAHVGLTALGRPATSVEIARKVEELYAWRAPVTAVNVCHAMVSHKEDFVTARRHLFALKEWGLPRPPMLKDLLAGYVRTKGGRASHIEICQAAEAEGYKTSSAKQMLHSHPELFRRAGPGVWELAQ